MGTAKKYKFNSGRKMNKEKIQIIKHFVCAIAHQKQWNNNNKNNIIISSSNIFNQKYYVIFLNISDAEDEFP